MIRKPMSPEEYDAMTESRKRRSGPRPTREEYEAKLAEYEASQAPHRAAAALEAKYVAVGGKGWASEDFSKRRVYFNDLSVNGGSGYVDLFTGELHSNDVAAFRQYLAAKGVLW